MLRAVLFKSKERFPAFEKKLMEYGIACTVLDFSAQEWIGFDYGKTDLIIYYPSFEYSSNHPLALHKVFDNLMFIHSEYPHIQFYPDPKIIKFYNDKYKQYLFLKTHDYPIPETLPLLSEESIELAGRTLGYPMVVKNRFGAGGGSVFMAYSKEQLRGYFNLAQLDLFNLGSLKHFARMLSERIFFYHLIKAKRMSYPFLSPPLLAQKFLKIDRDLKTVVGNHKVVEAHWRIQADKNMWKMNIDGGGTGMWGRVPQEAMDLSVRLSKELDASWVNLDIIACQGSYYITEFSPVWHHYKYKEKPSFVYKDDYNIDVPLEISLDLERIIIESLMKAVQEQQECIQKEA